MELRNFSGTRRFEPIRVLIATKMQIFFHFRVSRELVND